MRSGTWLDLYRRGERGRVWHELRQLGAAVREEEHLGEAQAVCDEMALRARRNIQVVIDRLTVSGYRFHSNDHEQTPVAPFLPASDGAGALVSWLTARFGAVPLTMSSWLRLVGDVWLVGTHPEWDGAAAADPLVIEAEGLRWPHTSIRNHYDEEFDIWQMADPEGAEPFVLAVAPDHLHKANVSGGAPYGFRLPDGCADGVFVGEVAMPFVDYLNWVFEQGGFPGRGGARLPSRLRRSLSEGLLPL